MLSLLLLWLSSGVSRWRWFGGQQRVSKTRDRWWCHNSRRTCLRSAPKSRVMVPFIAVVPLLIWLDIVMVVVEGASTSLVPALPSGKASRRSQIVKSPAHRRPHEWGLDRLRSMVVRRYGGRVCRSRLCSGHRVVLLGLRRSRNVCSARWDVRLGRVEGWCSCSTMLEIGRPRRRELGSRNCLWSGSVRLRRVSRVIHRCVAADRPRTGGRDSRRRISPIGIQIGCHGMAAATSTPSTAATVMASVASSPPTSIVCTGGAAAALLTVIARIVLCCIGSSVVSMVVLLLRMRVLLVWRLVRLVLVRVLVLGGRGRRGRRRKREPLRIVVHGEKASINLPKVIETASMHAILFFSDLRAAARSSSALLLITKWAAADGTFRCSGRRDSSVPKDASNCKWVT